MTATVSEKARVERIIRNLNRLPRSHAHKVHGSAYSSGEPDVDACIAGLTVKVEVKQPGKRPTPLQQRRLDQWAAAGAVAFCATTWEEVLAELRAAAAWHLDDGRQGLREVLADAGHAIE